MMSEQKLTPDVAQIKAHLYHITRRWDEIDAPAKLELVYLTADDKAKVKQVSHYDTDPESIELAASDCVGMNQHGINAYAVVNPVDANNIPGPMRKASGEHILGSFFHWADADDARAAQNIRNFVGPKGTFYVLTGTQPCERPHIYWELEDFTANLGEWEKIQKAIAGTLKTDPTVTDPPRIMRIGGSVNWPKPSKQAKGYVAEVTALHIHNEDDRPLLSSERMQRAFKGAPVDNGSSFQIDTGAMETLDREREAVKAMSGTNWNIAVFKLVGSYVRKGLSDGEIHALTDPLTIAGYTVADTREDVQLMIDRTRANPAFESEEPQEISIDTAATTKPDLSGELEYFDDIEPALTDAYLVKNVLAAGAMSVVYGASNSGKTFYALDMAYHMSAGGLWRDLRTTPASVLYLAAEGGRGIANRIVALKRETGASGLPFALRRAGMDLLKSEADLQRVYDLASEVKERGNGRPLLIVIDTLSRVIAGGDENSAADMTALIRNIDAIREATGAHIMLVHHTGKDAAKGARGHSSLRAATDTEIEVQNDDGFRSARVTKQRDYAGGEEFCFTLKAVDIGLDQDGDTVTSCVLEIADADDAPIKPRKLTKNQKVLVDTFDQLVADVGKPNPGGSIMPEAGRFMTLQMDEFRSSCEGKFTAKNTRDAFLTAFDALNAPGGLFCLAGGYVWRTDREKQ